MKFSMISALAALGSVTASPTSLSKLTTREGGLTPVTVKGNGKFSVVDDGF